MTSSRRRRAAVQVWARDLGAASRVSAVALPLAVSPSAPSPAALRAFHPAHDPTAHDGTDRLSLRAHALERCDLALRAEALAADRVFAVKVHDHEVRVGTDLERALLRVQTPDLGGHEGRPPRVLLEWTCGSMTPGRMYLPVASMASRASGSASSCEMATMMPTRTARPALMMPEDETIRPPRTTRSTRPGLITRRFGAGRPFAQAPGARRRAWLRSSNSRVSLMGDSRVFGGREHRCVGSSEPR